MNTKVEQIAFGLAVFLLVITPIAYFGGLIILLSDYCPPKQGGAVLNGVICVQYGSILLFAVTCIVSSLWIEKAHCKALAAAEQEFSDITVSNMKTLPPNWNPSGTVFLCENVVMANDYLKSFFWTWRKIFGGRSQSFERLFERGRREATVRLLRKARECGVNVVWNVRYEMSAVGLNQGKNSIKGLEILAYGTGFVVNR
jgi:uncharacterized protein YbjQ (UPF0145 family)